MDSNSDTLCGNFTELETTNQLRSEALKGLETGIDNDAKDAVSKEDSRKTKEKISENYLMDCTVVDQNNISITLEVVFCILLFF